MKKILALTIALFGLLSVMLPAYSHALTDSELEAYYDFIELSLEKSAPHPEPAADVLDRVYEEIAFKYGITREQAREIAEKGLDELELTDQQSGIGAEFWTSLSEIEEPAKEDFDRLRQEIKDKHGLTRNEINDIIYKTGRP